MLPTALLRALSQVRSVGAITGAGISAESGIPTYRGEGGVYDDPDEGDRLMASLTGEALLANPDQTWLAIAALVRQAQGAAPNEGHQALVAIEEAVDRFVLVTQNVDGLHQQAGSREVIDIHGSVNDTRCMECGDRGTIEDIHEIECAPKCDKCGGTLRPDVVLFGELLPMDKVARMRHSLQVETPDLIIAVGTTALFPYIAEPVWTAKMTGSLTVEVNPEPTVLSEMVDFSIRGKAGEILPKIAEAIVTKER